MSLPKPKELLKSLAQVHDTIVDVATKPIRDIIEGLGLPTPPEPPKATELVESLPELPTPEALAGKRAEEKDKRVIEKKKVKIEQAIIAP